MGLSCVPPDGCFLLLRLAFHHLKLSNMTDKLTAPTSKKPNSKPDLPKWLFWEYDYNTIDWQAGYNIVIERVLDRGTDLELDELIRFYGRDKVVHVLQWESIYLMDHSIERACRYFNFEKEELWCYHRKQIKRGNWL